MVGGRMKFIIEWILSKMYPPVLEDITITDYESIPDHELMAAVEHKRPKYFFMTRRGSGKPLK
jgi:hypothetical protein